MRVLVVEDEQLLADTIAVGLRRAAMAVDVACAAVVDSGAQVRVLMLTAAADVADRVGGLGLGADDYLPKPFAFAELVARARALGRRSQPAVPPVLVRGELRLDAAQRVASRAGRRLSLSPKEF